MRSRGVQTAFDHEDLRIDDVTRRFGFRADLCSQLFSSVKGSIFRCCILQRATLFATGLFTHSYPTVGMTHRLRLARHGEKITGFYKTWETFRNITLTQIRELSRTERKRGASHITRKKVLSTQLNVYTL